MDEQTSIELLSRNWNFGPKKDLLVKKRELSLSKSGEVGHSKFFFRENKSERLFA